MSDSTFIPLSQDANSIARLIHTLKEGTSIFFSFDNNTGHSFDWIAVECQHSGAEITYYVNGTGTDVKELEDETDIDRLAEDIAHGGYHFYIVQPIEGYKKFRDPYEDDQAIGSYEVNGADPVEPQFENLNTKPMKIKQQLLESLIRVCAKEVLSQLTEGKKAKKCKCGTELILGANQCKKCLEEAGLTSEGKDKWIQKAVNPAHKGDCTPMSKSTCTPKKKALAKRFKSGDIHADNVEEETTEDEGGNDICPTCNGSGEGMADGLKCSSCKGSGSTRRGKLSKRNDPDYDWDSEREESKLHKNEIDEEDSNTIGAPQTGSGESVDIETTPPEIEDEPSEPETPKKKEKLQGIVLLTPDGQTRSIPIKMFPSEGDIERVLHRIGANLAGNKVKVSISALRTIKTNLKSGKPIFCFLGTLSEEADELFVFANTNLNAAKEEMAPIEKIKGEEVSDINTDNQFITHAADDEQWGKHLSGADKPHNDIDDDSSSGQD